MSRRAFTAAQLAMNHATRQSLERNARLAADLARLLRELRQEPGQTARPAVPAQKPKIRLIR